MDNLLLAYEPIASMTDRDTWEYWNGWRKQEKQIVMESMRKRWDEEEKRKRNK